MNLVRLKVGYICLPFPFPSKLFHVIGNNPTVKRLYQRETALVKAAVVIAKLIIFLNHQLSLRETRFLQTLQGLPLFHS